MYRNFVFDMGMVLLDYHPIEACRHYAPDEDGAQKLMDAIFRHPDWVRLDAGELTEETLVPLAQARLADPALRALAPELLTHWHEYTFTQIPGMDAIIDFLKDSGRRVYVLSNAGYRFRAYEALIPRIERFNGVTVSAEERVIKPSAEIYRRLCDKFSLKPEECYFIDDVPRNIEGAKAVGFGGYVFDGDSAKLLDELKRIVKGA